MVVLSNCMNQDQDIEIEIGIGVGIIFSLLKRRLKEIDLQITSLKSVFIFTKVLIIFILVQY